MFRAPEELDADEQRQIAHILEHCSDVAAIRPLVQTFRGLVREFDGAALDGWLEKVEGAGVAELMAFAARIHRDRVAIDAMLEVASNRQLEGQVHRLKTLKRAMCGRANLDLLRQRVLHASRSTSTETSAIPPALASSRMRETDFYLREHTFSVSKCNGYPQV